MSSACRMRVALHATAYSIYFGNAAFSTERPLFFSIALKGLPLLRNEVWRRARANSVT